MFTFILIIFIVSCITLIMSILLQSGKGGGLGEMFGGGSTERSLFGGMGAQSFVYKATVVAAIVFIVTAVILSAMYSRGLRVQQTPQAPVAPISGGTTP